MSDADGTARDDTKPSAQTQPPDIAVVGLGRFGLFWASLLAQRHTVVGTSRRALSSLPSGVRQVSLDEAAQAPIIFLTVAISAMPDALRTIAPHLRPGTLVVDTCSVKVWPVRQMVELLPDSCEIIASHPMFGPDSARESAATLPMITWPVRVGNDRYRSLLETLIELGMQIHEMSPDDHDREAAMTQGVTHLVGRVLSAMTLSESTIATLGYRRLLQVMGQTCNDPETLFRDLQRYNPYTRDMRHRFAEALRATESLLADDLDSPGSAR